MMKSSDILKYLDSLYPHDNSNKKKDENLFKKKLLIEKVGKRQRAILKIKDMINSTIRSFLVNGETHIYLNNND